MKLKEALILYLKDNLAITMKLTHEQIIKRYVYNLALSKTVEFKIVQFG